MVAHIWTFFFAVLLSKNIARLSVIIVMYYVEDSGERMYG